jgi:hypothetical protein
MQYLIIGEWVGDPFSSICGAIGCVGGGVLVDP